MTDEYDFHNGNRREHIAALLAQAQRLILSTNKDEILCAACVADAGLLLRQLIESEPQSSLQIGVGRPTRRGAMLPGMRA